MDTFEHNEYSVPGQDAQPGAYRGAGAGRKESPFANSPYEMGPRPVSQPQSRPEPRPQPQPEPQPAQQDYRRTYYYEPETPPEQPKKSATRKKKTAGKFWKRAAAAVAALALVVGSCMITASVVNDRWEARTNELEAQFALQLEQLQDQINAADQQNQQVIIGNPVAAEGYLTPSQVYAQNVDSVVIVYSQVVYYSYGQKSTGTSTGSGFIISEDGYVLTNHHVIEGAQSVTVVSHSGEQYEATIVGSDSTNDVALLKLNATGLPAVTLGSSDALIVGDQVAAIGNPLGELTSTMTVGYISGKERAVTTDGTTINMIQTDAAINSGNSGGPLFNMKGEVIGITTAKYSGQSSSGASIEGIGFAIPIDDVMEVAGDLLEFGYVKTAYMGVTVRDMDPTVAEMYNLPVGVYVESVEADGPAAKAGILPEDIIIALDGNTVRNYSELGRVLRNLEPGNTTTVVVFRGGRELELSITLAEKPHTPVAQDEQTQPDSGMPSEGSYEEWYKYFEPFFGKGDSGN